jgi:hypothetical protein
MSALHLIDAGRGDCENIALHLLGQNNKRMSGRSGLRWGNHGSFRLRTAGAKRGKWTDYASGEYGDVLDLVERETGSDTRGALEWLERWFGGSVAPIDREAQIKELEQAERAEQAVREAKLKAAAAIWIGAQRFPDTLADKFLSSRIGCAVPADVIAAGQIRFHPAPYFDAKRFGVDPAASERAIAGCAGAMIARMVDPITGEGRGIHRTFLDATGAKLERRMLGGSGIVRLLDPDAAGDAFLGLGLGEGLESSLSVITEWEWRPVWASMTAGNMRMFPLLNGVESLTLFADNDEEKDGKRAGNDAALICATRWAEAGREATIWTPPVIGTDFNDMIERNAA